MTVGFTESNRTQIYIKTKTVTSPICLYEYLSQTLKNHKNSQTQIDIAQENKIFQAWRSFRTLKT